jgi:hypothetical protein
MVLVQHPIKLGAAPRRPQFEPYLARLKASAQRFDRETVKLSTFQARPGGPMHTSPPSAVDLA